MEKIEIGDNVIALSSTPCENAQTRIKGKIYKVCDISYCSKCGLQLLNIGQASPNDATIECTCNYVGRANGLMWTFSTEFRKLTSDSLEALESEAVENEDYELAGTLRDLQKV
jgi:hypothetical protein